MSSLIKLEVIGIFLLCVFLFSQLNFSWWWFPLLLLMPDVSMIGYLINTKIGAYTYNFVHHRFVAVLIALYALINGNEYWKLAAIILFAHISFDRILGYGLKYNYSFNNTHLVKIDKK